MSGDELSVRVSPTRSPVLHVGILTYNGLHHTQRCVSSLLAHTKAPWCALLRDNASSDATPAWLQSLDDARITVHCGEDNLGVSGGRNWLLEQLVPRLHDDDLIVLLDNDIELFPGWETPFMEAFAAHPRLGIAGRWAFSMLVHDGWRDILAENGLTAGPVDTVQGCVFWIRAAAARAIGGFDLALGRFWHEDDDYSIRALSLGWDVQRVETDAIVHHEHGSGVALRADRMLGSARNQHYLTQKWRTMGAIDADGVPRRPTPELHAPLLAHLRAALGRRVLRTELNSALVDLTLLLHREVSDARAATLATPAVRAMLCDMARDEPVAAARAGAARARVEEVLALRRASAPVAPRATTRALSAVCTPAVWDDPRWRCTSESALRDGSGLDFYARSETRWRDGQLWLALRTLGALRRDARVLLLGHPVEPLAAALTHHVGSLVVCDHESWSADAVLAHARQPLGAASVTLAPWPLANGADGCHHDAATAAPGFDLVLVPNLSRYAPASAFPRILATLGGHARRGAVVAVGVSVRIAGPANGRWVEAAQCADDALLAKARLQRVGPFDAAVADETLLAAVPDDAPVTMRPRLARAIGDHCVTLATLVTRRV